MEPTLAEHSLRTTAIFDRHLVVQSLCPLALQASDLPLQRHNSKCILMPPIVVLRSWTTVGSVHRHRQLYPPYQIKYLLRLFLFLRNCFNRSSGAAG